MVLLLKCFTVKAMSCSSSAHSKNRLKSPVFPSSPSLPALNNSWCHATLFVHLSFSVQSPFSVTFSSNLESICSSWHVASLLPTVSQSQSNIAVLAIDKQIKESAEQPDDNKWKKRSFYHKYRIIECPELERVMLCFCILLLNSCLLRPVFNGLIMD